MPSITESQDSAFIAGQGAIDAAAELLRFKREGFAIGMHPFGDPEPVAQLAEALLRTARIEADLFPGNDQEDQDYRSGVNQLAAACAKFLSDHCNAPLALLTGAPAGITEAELPY